MATNFLDLATDHFYNGESWAVYPTELTFSGPGYGPEYRKLRFGSSSGVVPLSPEGTGDFSFTVTMTGSSKLMSLYVFDLGSSVPITCPDGVPTVLTLNYPGSPSSLTGINIVPFDTLGDYPSTPSSDDGNFTVTAASYSGGIIIVPGPFWKDFVGCASSD